MPHGLEEIQPVQNKTVNSYISLLKQLLPSGILWRNLNVAWNNLLKSFAEELFRIDEDILRMYTESIPGLSTDAWLLNEWEDAVLNEDEKTGGTELERQTIVQGKIIGGTATEANFLNGPTEQFFIDYADFLGITITITGVPDEAFRVGNNVVGERLTSDRNVYVWVVNHSGGTAATNEAMKAAFTRLAPAHTEVRFEPPV